MGQPKPSDIFLVESKWIDAAKAYRPHIGAECSRCDFVEWVTIAPDTSPGYGRRIFAKRGWAIADRRKAHICPRCIAIPRKGQKAAKTAIALVPNFARGRPFAPVAASPKPDAPTGPLAEALAPLKAAMEAAPPLSEMLYTRHDNAGRAARVMLALSGQMLSPQLGEHYQVHKVEGGFRYSVTPPLTFMLVKRPRRYIEPGKPPHGPHLESVKAYFTDWGARNVAIDYLRAHAGVANPVVGEHYGLKREDGPGGYVWRWVIPLRLLPDPPPPQATTKNIPSRSSPLVTKSKLDPTPEKETPMTAVEIHNATLVESPAPEVHAPAPREPALADNRRIRDALEAHYDEPHGRYHKAFSDTALAETLKVPRAWVAKVREAFYGPDVNEASQIKRADIDAAIQAVDVGTARLLELAQEAEDIGLKLRAARKLLG